jgi:hypothetical protein
MTDPLLPSDPVAVRRAIDRSFADWLPILKGLDGVRMDRDDLAIRWTSPVPLPVFNGVMTDRDDPVDASWVDGVLAPFVVAGTPLLWADMACRDDLAELLAARGLETDRPAAMAIDLTRLPVSNLPPGVTIQEVDHDPLMIGVATSISMRTNGFPDEAVAPMLVAVGRMPRRASLRTFLLFADDEPVAASSLLLGADVAGLYNVGTLEAHRGRGYGRAVSIAAMAAGRDAGMRVGVLQASSMGEPIYRGIGFGSFGRQLWAAGLPST